MAANLSAIRLRKAAQALEDACSSRDKSRTLRRITALNQALGAVAAIVEKLKQPESASADDPSCAQGGCSLPGNLLFKFNQSLEKLDLAKSEACLVELEARSVSTDHKPALKNLKEQILAFDFNGARKTLRSLSEKLDM